MPQGRGQGWEEKIQQPALRRFLDERGWKCTEYELDMTDFKKLKHVGNARPDFLVDHGAFYELIECKNWNHPTFKIAAALGQALVYRALMRMKGETKEIHLSLCFVNGYGDQEGGDWTSAHDALLRGLSSSCGEPIGLYLVQPVRPEYAAIEHLWDPEKHHASQRLCVGENRQ